MCGDVPAPTPVKASLDVCLTLLEMITFVTQELMFITIVVVLALMKFTLKTLSGMAVAVPPPAPAVPSTLHPGSARSSLSQLLMI